MRKPFTLLASLLLCLCSHAVTRIVQSNTGNGWGNATNWLPNGVPQDGDVVMIPPGKTISVKGSFYGTAANLTIYIHGHMDFDPSGKLNLGAASLVQLTSTSSQITSNGTSSEQIIIGGGIKYNGSNDGTITGPAFTNGAAPNSSSGTAKRGFTFGVLPVQLTTFTASASNGQLQLNWTTVQEEGLQHFELQRSPNGRDWINIATIQPRNSCACATSYSYQDRSAANGPNYYRLHAIDTDGRAAFTSVIQSRYHGLPNEAVAWQVNRAGASLSVSLHPSQWQYPVQLQLLATNGQLVMTKKLVSAYTSLDLQTLSSGVAVLLLEDGTGKKYTAKILR